MRIKVILGSPAALLACAVLALAQGPAYSPNSPVDKVIGSAPGVEVLLVEAAAPHQAQAPAAIAIPAPATSPTALMQSDGCPAGSRFWASSEYLLWWLKGSPLPVPLVTSSTDPTGATSGAIGEPGTTVLIGNHAVDGEERAGGRFTLGMWLDPCEHFGLEGNYFFVAPRTATQLASSSCAAGTAAIGNPFFDPSGTVTRVPGTPGETFALTGQPGVSAGAYTLSIRSLMQGGELNGVAKLFETGSLRWTALAGFRYLELVENLELRTSEVGVAGGPIAGLALGIDDQFSTRNHFYGGQIGTRAEFSRGNWFASAAARVALGDMQENVRINGATALVLPGTPTTVFPGGLFASSTNSGKFQRDQFAVVPEVNLNVGVNVLSGLRASVGYSFLYASELARPGPQIDPVINATQLPALGGSATTLTGPARPAFSFKGSDFWAQGMNFGLEFRY